MLCIRSSEFTHVMAAGLYPFNSLFLILQPPLQSLATSFLLCFYELDFFFLKILCSVCFSLAGSLQLVYQGGPPQKTELSSGGLAPSSPGFPHYENVLGTHLYLLAFLWEAVFCFSEFIFWRLFQCLCHFMVGDSRAHLPTWCWVFSSFWPKIRWPPCPTCPIHLISFPLHDFFCFPGWKKKSSKGNILPMWKRWSKKWQRH